MISELRADYARGSLNQFSNDLQAFVRAAITGESSVNADAMGMYLAEILIWTHQSKDPARQKRK